MDMNRRDNMIRRAIRQRKNPRLVFHLKDNFGKWHTVWVHSKHKTEMFVFGTKGMDISENWWMRTEDRRDAQEIRRKRRESVPNMLPPDKRLLSWKKVLQVQAVRYEP